MIVFSQAVFDAMIQATDVEHVPHEASGCPVMAMVSYEATSVTSVASAVVITHNQAFIAFLMRRENAVWSFILRELDFVVYHG